MPVFAKKLNKVVTANPLAKLVDHLETVVGGQPKAGQTNLARAAISTESFSDELVQSLDQSLNSITASLEAYCATHGLQLATAMPQSKDAFEPALERHAVLTGQFEAAAAAGVLAGDVRTFLSHKFEPLQSTPGLAVVPTTEGYAERPMALEAYDERDNRNAAVFSVAYNMQSARQDEFGETFFPTIVLSPDQNGFTITVRLMQVYNEFKRQTSGALDQYQKKNIIRALADPTILKNEQTRIIPVRRPESQHNFVAAADLAPIVYDLEGEAIPTSALMVGKKFSLIALSQTDALLQSGVMDMTDSIEPAIRLKSVVVKIGADVLKFNVQELPTAEFNYAPQGNYRLMQLNFSTTSVLVNKNTKLADGSALVDLASVVTNDLMVRLELNLSGSVNCELGDTQIFGNNIACFQVQNNTGEILDPASPPADAIYTLLAGAEILGYELLAYRSNLNRRQRGQLIDTTFYTQAYNVNFSAPITAIHPVTMDAQTDASDLQSLVTATRIRTSNNAVKTLLDAARTLDSYQDARDELGVGPDVLGVGRFFVRPVYFYEELDMTLLVDSLTSHERAEDMQSALVNKIRDYAYRMYRDSEYKAAADAFAGGLAPVPTVIIGTDPVLSRYLTVTGDLRTLGGEFNVRVVSTLDNRVKGKIFVTFGVFDEGRNTEPNPLNFGNMIWSPELTVVLPIARDGQISKELTVAPRFRHIVNLPILTVLEVTNVPNVINKVPVNMHQV